MLLLNRCIFLILAALFVSALSAQELTVETLAGVTNSLRDGTGAAARFDFPIGAAVDSSGNVYVADTLNHTVRKISSAGVVTTLAGTAGTSGSADGTGAAARFSGPYGVAVDSSGNVYVADTTNHTIRKISSVGVVTTLAGTANSWGSSDGAGSAARFRYPDGVAVGSSGNVYVADTGNHTIRKISPAGVVTTLAGTASSSGSADGTGAAARFNDPYGVAVDSSGNVYVADTLNHTVRKIGSAGVVTTLAGTAGSSGSADGTGAAARFYRPSGVAVDSSGNLYVADAFNYAIRKISPAGVVTTLAGTAGNPGNADGIGAAARFFAPRGVAVDSLGNVYVADTNNDTIRKISPTSVVTTLAGSAAYFSTARGVAVDSSGNVYVPGYHDHTIHKISPTGVDTTLAGLAYTSGGVDGTGGAARFRYPCGVAVDSVGNVYVADTDNHTIRKVTSAGVVTTLAGSPGISGSIDGAGSAARFNYPYGVAVDSAGNVYVADTNNSTIRKISPTGTVTTFAGTAGSSGSADGTGAAARFAGPTGVAVDSSGNVYVADFSNHKIRKISSAGVVTTLAGTAGSSGSADGTGAAARFYQPAGVAVDSSGNVYVADTYNDAVRKISSAGVVTTLAGSAAGSGGSADGTGPAARFDSPRGIAVDSSGIVYIADTENDTIRKCIVSITDSATIDNAIGMTGQTRQLDTTGSSATAWSWEWIRHPGGSSATLSSTTIQNPSFTPDIEDVYIWQLTATGPSGKSITYVTLAINNSLPVISIKASLPYTAGSGAVLLDANATVQDADSTDFDTGNLTILGTGMAEDDLTISSTGTVRLNGTSVEYDASAAFSGSEVVIGTLTSNGLAGADFIITFNASCTPAIAQELLRQIQYEDTLTTPNTTPRSISITLTDDTSLTSASTSVQLVVTASSGGDGGDDDSGCTAQSTSNLWPLLVLLSLLAISATRRKLARLE